MRKFKPGEKVRYGNGKLGIVVKEYKYFVLLKDKKAGYRTCEYPESLTKVGR